jgi:cell division septum initiation protein DivIVA
MDLRPAEIAMRQFSRTLLGVDPAEVRQFLAEAAAALDRVNSELAGVILERTTLQTTLKQTCAEVEALRRQLAVAHERLSAYQGQESLMAQVLLNAERVTEDLTRESKAQAERTIAEANAAAQEAVQSARNAAADLLRTARVRAQQAIEAADRVAAARLAEIRIDAESMVDEARRTAAEVQQAARQQVEHVIARLETFLAAREDLSEQLDALAKSHGESLEVVGRMHAEVEEVILPALRDQMRALTEREASLAPPPAPVQPAAPSEHVPIVPQPSINGGKGVRAPTAQGEGEIVVTPVHSYLQATKLVTAVSRVRGVRTARLRTYSKGSITIDVLTEEDAFASLDPHLIDGFPLDIVEATDRRLVLRIGNGGSRPSNIDAT